ncbi:PREDICTED: heat shock factor 2-binding protein-like [Priapulus caudatus]|uniref:Heat shock factor 2-binding protein-like n=1 Tax=Priapulus caudatus TaxID=37621 RepID=A0ABM1EZP0_PRICU|nr:PREDICTED: heat shock factor 2-binding protein-like [Priapulus caudatus]
MLELEAKQLKQSLKQTIQQDIHQLSEALDKTLDETETLRAKLGGATAEVSCWKSRLEAKQQILEEEKEEKCHLRCEAQLLSNQLGQQSEYCVSLGSALATLLWRVSQTESSTHAMLQGSKVDDFLRLVVGTLDSYVQTYNDDTPCTQMVEDSEESHFVLALCGIITNIAAVPYGRHFLMGNVSGRELVEMYTDVLRSISPPSFPKLRKLLLMALYNVSINKEGLKLLSQSHGIIGRLAYTVTSDTCEGNREHALRLIQSLVYEMQSPGLLQELLEVLPRPTLQELSEVTHGNLQKGIIEMMTDLVALTRES